ncbi:MAG: FAD-dependent oxidoreductase, partial [Gaiellaceae bacterium]
MRQTRYGWWLEDAGPIEATAPLASDTAADVVIVGGGYLGLWSAWQLKQLEPELDVVVLEAGLAGHGPSGRNGGFVSTIWDDLPTLRERFGDARAVEACRASERGVDGIRQW